MKILIAPDKFKGSLTAAQAARAIRRGVERSLPQARCRELPIADGGEGTAEVLCAAMGGEWIDAAAHDPLGRVIEARYALLPDRLAIIAMSAASGLWRVGEAERDLWLASTFGTGELMADAIGRGAHNILVGLGGSATNDGGIGMAAALGWRFVDGSGRPLEALPANLPALRRLVRSEGGFPEVMAMCDVDNPLLGEHGASRTYGRQKGGDSTTLAELDTALEHLADVASGELGVDFRHVPGAGAAGGLGFGLLTFCGATLRSGFEVVVEATGLREAVAEADLILTGEGCLDSQTLAGKGPAGVAALARSLGKPVVAFGGRVLASEALGRLFDGVFALAEDGVSVETAIREAASRLENKVADAMRDRA